MSNLPILFVNDSAHFNDRRLDISTINFGTDSRGDLGKAISHIGDAVSSDIVCFRCADDRGTVFESDDPVLKTWRETLVISGELGEYWRCDSCDRLVYKMDENTDAYIYVCA